MINAKLRKAARWTGIGIGALLAACVVLLSVFLIVMTFLDYKPSEKESLAMENKILPDTVPVGKLELYTWNIGYAGLGKDMDFFYDNGKQTMPAQPYYERCRDGILYQLTTLNKLDFILLQEVDRHARRTYLDDQVARFRATFSDYDAFFAVNYQVPFVPLPLRSPMGKVKSGMLSLSRFKPVEAVRYRLPSAYGWPKKLFMPDRCVVLTRFNTANGRQLVVLNVHNSASSDASALREKETGFISKLIADEYAKGNYVIAGGDWNQNPPAFNADSIKDGNLAKPAVPAVKNDLLPSGFTWVFDPAHPTNREVSAPYVKGKTATSVIDFFVLSPNIKLITANTLVNNFEFSDHQAVGMIVELLP